MTMTQEKHDELVAEAGVTAFYTMLQRDISCSLDECEGVQRQAEGGEREWLRPFMEDGPT